jgi:GNAT superfamily N-acetyltransferase
MNWKNGGYSLTDDGSRLRLDVICALLKNTYWAANRSRETIEQCIKHSLCFGLFHGDAQVGFARVITDYSTFSYLCDVVIAPEHRGQGMGKWLLQCILEHPDLPTTRFTLFTKDAQAFYRQFGFRPHEFDCLVRPPNGSTGGTALTAGRKSSAPDGS